MEESTTSSASKAWALDKYRRRRRSSKLEKLKGTSRCCATALGKWFAGRPKGEELPIEEIV